VVADALIKASPLVRFRREMAESMRGPGARKSERMKWQAPRIGCRTGEHLPSEPMERQRRPLLLAYDN